MTGSITEPEFSLRIIGGYNAYPGQFPYHVSLQYRNSSERDLHACGGSIIDKKWILTAAHCFSLRGIELNKDTLIIKAGRYNISKDHEVGEQIMTVDGIFKHESHVDVDNADG